jgi:hypothetical protein
MFCAGIAPPTQAPVGYRPCGWDHAIRSGGLHPALVVVNADWFFRNELSPCATEVVQTFAFKARVNYAADRRRVAVARAFKAALDARGARLLVTCVSGPDARRSRAACVAADLGVPLIAPRLDDLATCDRSHLTTRDAIRFADAFLREFHAWHAAAAPGQVAQVGTPACCP